MLTKASFILTTLLLVTLSAHQAMAEAKFQKVLTIIFENTDYKKALSQPYFSELAQNGALLENYYAVTHPSQGNYIALTSGSIQGVTNDSNVNLDVTHIGDLLEAQGRTWKTYAEDFPGNCYLKSSKGSYARKHVPFISYTNVQSNPTRCDLIQDQKSFDNDVQNQSLPNYSFYVPNLKNDGHDTGVSYADKWLKTKFGNLFKDPQFMSGMLVIITFDEGSNSKNQVYTVLLGDSVKSGVKSSTTYNHYSLLRLIEDEWGLGNLGLNDQSATQISGIWK